MLFFSDLSMASAISIETRCSLQEDRAGGNSLQEDRAGGRVGERLQSRAQHTRSCSLQLTAHPEVSREEEAQ